MSIINLCIVFLIGLLVGLIFARSFIVKRMQRRRDRYNFHHSYQRRRRSAFGGSIFMLIISFITLTAFSVHKARSDIENPVEEERWTLEEDGPVEEEVNISF